MLSVDEIEPVFQRFYFDGMGAVSRGDAKFLCDLIKESQPAKCFEVGVASGMSTTFLLKALAKVGPETELVSVDISRQYYADRTKQVGYIVDAAIPELVVSMDCTSTIGLPMRRGLLLMGNLILFSSTRITVILGQRSIRCWCYRSSNRVRGSRSMTLLSMRLRGSKEKLDRSMLTNRFPHPRRNHSSKIRTLERFRSPAATATTRIIC